MLVLCYLQIHTTLSVIATIVHLVVPMQNITVTDGTTELHIEQPSSNFYAYLIGPAIIQFVIALCFMYGVAKASS